MLLVATAAAAGLAAALALAARSAGRGPAQLDSLVESGVAACGVLVCTWLAGSALLGASCLLVRACGASWRAGERAVHRFAPAAVRRAVTVVVTAGVGVGLATGAQAAAPPPAPGVVSVSSDATTGRGLDLGWVVTAHEQADGPATDAAGREPMSAPAAPATLAPDLATVPVGPTVDDHGPATVTVRPGDSLWRIAARHLPPGSTAAQVAASWPAWFEANRGVIGTDPGVIEPGQVLVVPTGVTL